MTKTKNILIAKAMHNAKAAANAAEQAAKAIQKVWRGHAAREVVRPIKLAVVTLQKWWRGHAARKVGRSTSSPPSNASETSTATTDPASTPTATAFQDRECEERPKTPWTTEEELAWMLESAWVYLREAHDRIQHGYHG